MRLVILAVFVVWAGGVAEADTGAARSKLAVLGVEVTSKAGSPAVESVDLAVELTSLLKARAARSDSPHRAVETDKDLATLRTEARCTTGAPYCMTPLAVQLGADLLMWGSLEKVALGHQVTLTVMDGKTRKVQTLAEVLEPDFSTGIPLARWSEDAYAKVTTANANNAPPPPPPSYTRTPMPPRPPPRPRPALSVLGLEGAHPADEVTKLMRAEIMSYNLPFRALADNYALASLKRQHRCANEAAACMAAIGRAIGAEHVIWGRLSRRSGKLVAKLTIIDVTAVTTHVVEDSIAAADAKPGELKEWTKQLMRALAYRHTVYKPPAPPKTGFVDFIAVDRVAASATFARELSTEMRGKIASTAGLRVVRTSCSIAKPACFAAAGKAAGVTKVVYGTIERVGGLYHLTIKVVDVAKREVSAIRNESAASAASAARAIERSVPSGIRDPFGLELDI